MMQTTVLQPELRPDLQSLGEQLQTLFAETPVWIRCILRDDRLIVLGQHEEDVPLDDGQILRSLERKIQSLQLGVIRQVQLYLRVWGERDPYAHRRFMIQPLPPPPNPNLCQIILGESAPESWVPGDEELGTLVQQLTAAGERTFDSLTIAGSSLPALPGDGGTESPHPLGKFGLDRKTTLAVGAVAIGLAGATYGLTRPCVVNACPEIQTAQGLSQTSIRAVQNASTRQDLESAHQQLEQAVEVLSPIPLWSSRYSEAQTLGQTYQTQATQIDQMTGIEDIAAIAREKTQNAPHSSKEWQSIRALWLSAIRQLEKTPTEGDLAPFIQRQLQQYRDKLAIVDQHIQREKEAEEILEMSRSAAKLAKAREGVAQTVLNWQLVRATWQAALDRLQQVPPGTAAAQTAANLRIGYQAELNRIRDRIQKEQTATRIFEQANEEALKAQAAEQTENWQTAIASWSSAVSYARQVPQGSSYQTQAESLLAAYNSALTQAEQKLESTKQIQTEIDRLCVGQLKACNLVSVNTAIKVQLSADYVQAISSARGSGDRNLQAIVADHQLSLRNSLEQLSKRFKLPVEVYNPENTLLERHVPG